MAWSTPMTAVAGSAFTAAQFNTFVRDNLNATAPALATTAGQYFVATGVNTIVARTVGTNTILTSESTTSSTYADMTTIGPTVTATTGTSALVYMYCSATNNGTFASLMSYTVSGATTVAASDNNSVGGAFGTNGGRASGMFVQTGLTPGVNTFTGKYRVTPGATGTFSDRVMIVLPF